MQCYKTNYFAKIFDNPQKPIKYVNIGYGCKAPHCHNSHAFLGFGTISELETPFYSEMRNRVCLDGTEWLQPEMKRFMQCKLKDSNDDVRRRSDVLVNAVYRIIYPTAILVRNTLRTLFTNYRSNKRK